MPEQNMDKFEVVFEAVINRVKQAYLDDGLCPPVLVLVRLPNFRRVIDIPVGNPIDVLELFLHENCPDFFVLACEAWKSETVGVRPSEATDKEEIVMIIGKEKDGKEKLEQYVLVKEGERVRDLVHIETPTQEKGFFTGRIHDVIASW